MKSKGYLELEIWHWDGARASRNSREKCVGQEDAVPKKQGRPSACVCVFLVLFVVVFVLVFVVVFLVLLVVLLVFIFVVCVVFFVVCLVLLVVFWFCLFFCLVCFFCFFGVLCCCCCFLGCSGGFHHSTNRWAIRCICSVFCLFLFSGVVAVLHTIKQKVFNFSQGIWEPPHQNKKENRWLPVDSPPNPAKKWSPQEGHALAKPWGFADLQAQATHLPNFRDGHCFNSVWQVPLIHVAPLREVAPFSGAATFLLTPGLKTQRPRKKASHGSKSLDTLGPNLASELIPPNLDRKWEMLRFPHTDLRNAWRVNGKRMGPGTIWRAQKPSDLEPRGRLPACDAIGRSRCPPSSWDPSSSTSSRSARLEPPNTPPKRQTNKQTNNQQTRAPNCP